MSDLRITVTDGAIDIPDDERDRTTGALANAVALSLFIPPYWGNRIAEAAGRYTSRVDAARRGLLGVETARDVAASSRAALDWMGRGDIAASVDVRAEIAGRERINLRVGISESPRDRQEYVYGLNWAATEAEV